MAPWRTGRALRQSHLLNGRESPGFQRERNGELTLRVLEVKGGLGVDGGGVKSPELFTAGGENVDGAVDSGLHGDGLAVGDVAVLAVDALGCSAGMEDLHSSLSTMASLTAVLPQRQVSERKRRDLRGRGALDGGGEERVGES